MSKILSAEEVRSERYRYPDSTTEDGANDVISLCESHEALRAALDDAVEDIAVISAAWDASKVALEAAERERDEARTREHHFDMQCVDNWREVTRLREELAAQRERIGDWSAEWSTKLVAAERERDEASTAALEEYDITQRLGASLVSAEAECVRLRAIIDAVYAEAQYSSDAVPALGRIAALAAPKETNDE